MFSSIISFDHLVEQFFDLHRTQFLTEFFFWFTSLGDARVIIVLAISAAIILLRHHRSAYVIGLLTAVGGSFAFSYVLKLIVARGRPLPPLAAIDAPGYSFPSLHAACAIATYGFIAFIIWKLLHPPHHRMPLIIILAILIGLIGFSRMYLGVHYPSDIVGGYTVGAFFLWFATFITIRLERQSRHSVWRSGTISSRS